MSVWVLDLEADGLLDEATRVHCGVAKNIKSGEIKRFRPDDVPALLQFMDSCSALIMHNGIAYDLPLLDKLYQYKYKGKVIDTMVMSKVMRINLSKPKGHGKIGPHSIEAYGIRYGRHKPENEDWSVFTEHMLHRCEEDVEITHLLYDDLMMNEYTPQWRQGLALSHKFFELTSMMERYGWLFDVPKAERLVRVLEYLTHRIDRNIHLPKRLVRKYKEPFKQVFLKSGKGKTKTLLNWIEKHAPHLRPDDVTGQFSRIQWEEFNLGSGDQVKQFLLVDGWQPQEWNYKKENGREVYDESGDKVPTSPKLSQNDDFIGISSNVGRQLARRVQIQHRLSYLNGLLKSVRPDGRIPCSVAGLAKTYRVRHRGIVNTPGKKSFLGARVRELFTSKEGSKLASVDAASCQVRLEGARAKSREYSDMLLNADTHQIVTDAVNRVMRKLGKPEIIRDYGKNFNFALKFGAQDPKLGKMVNMSERVGTQIRASINEQFGAQDALIKKLKNEWRKNAKVRRRGRATQFYDGWIEGLDGRPVYIEAEYKVLVYALQSDETIFMQTAFCFWYKLLEQAGLRHGVDYGFVCHYHDEMTAEVREDKVQLAKELGELAITKASQYFKLFTPQKGDGAVGENWLTVH